MQRVVHPPVGPLLAEATERGIRRLAFLGAARPDQLVADPESLFLSALASQLEEDFAGRGRPLRPPLAPLPSGETTSSAALAAVAGAPGAYRAAGAACGANPVAIIVPCHRVVGSDGGLHGFGGGPAAQA